MYADFFGFRELPFNNTPDPRFFYSTPEHDEAIASLIYAVSERKGFVLLTGEVGAGKTLVTRLMLRHFGTNIAFANVTHAVQDADDLMESICDEFDLPITPDMGPAQVVRALHDYLLAQFAQNIPVVLVLDEAQSLPIEGFERLRMIGNLEADDAKLLQIAIVGQPELQRTFMSPKLRQLRQRIFRTFHLTALDRENTEGYIHHRLSVVTDKGSAIFAPNAFDAIHRISHGLPRIINTICDNALLSAYSADRREIDGAFIDLVAKQMMSPGETETSTRSYEPIGSPSSSHGTRPRIPARTGAADFGAPLSQEPPHREPRAMREFAERITYLETQLRTEPPAPAPSPPAAASTALADGVVAAFTNEMHELRRTVRLHMSQQGQRMEHVERIVGTSTEGVRQSSALRGELSEILRQNKIALRRTETATKILEQREQRLRSLAETLKSVVREMKPLLSRTTETVTACRQSDRDARTARERLAAQSHDARRLMGELTRFTARFETPISRTQGDTILKSATAAAASVPIAPIGSAAHRAERDEADSRLQQVRESLYDLRSLTHKSNRMVPKQVAVSDDQSTSRLASEVESLLDMVEDRETVSPA